MPSTILGEHAITLPSGTTAQRPTGAAGLIRHNTTTALVEFWDSVNNTWSLVNGFQATGGNTVTSYSSGGSTYTAHVFTSSGTFTISSGSGYIEILIVGTHAAIRYISLCSILLAYVSACSILFPKLGVE
jgi:hypothetical protein